MYAQLFEDLKSQRRRRVIIWLSFALGYFVLLLVGRCSNLEHRYWVTCLHDPARMILSGSRHGRRTVVLWAISVGCAFPAGLTQEARLQSGVTRNVLLAVEHGRRGLLYERLFDIADALGTGQSAPRLP